MNNHRHFSDEQFLEQFRNCSFPAGLFNHEAHLRLAWINIRKYGIDKAVREVQAQLENFVQFHGDSDKYNKTLTMAAVFIVNHFMQKSTVQDFLEFLSKSPGLVTNFKGLVESHYSFDIFNSRQAKDEYLEPDLMTFK